MTNPPSRLFGLMTAISILCGYAVFLHLPTPLLAQEERISTFPSPRPTTNPDGFLGKLYKIQGNTLVVGGLMFREDQSRESHTFVATDANTIFLLDFERATLSDLRPGMIIRCTSWASVSGPQKLLVDASGSSIGGKILKIEGNRIICPVNLFWVDHQATTVVFDDNTKAFYRPDITTPQVPVLQQVKLSDLKAGMTIEAVPDTGTAKTIFIYRYHNTISISPRDAASIASLPARQFNSKLALEIHLAPQQGMFSDLGPALGQTPREKPLAIPAGRMWCVIPAPGVDLDQLASEINAQHIPGVALTDVPAKTDLSFLEKLPDLRSLRLTGPGVTNDQLVHLKAMTKLEELYLQSDQNVTDAGLPHLEELGGAAKARSVAYGNYGLRLQGLLSAVRP